MGSGTVAVCEFRIDLKRMTVEFVSQVIFCTNSSHESIAYLF